MWLSNVGSEIYIYLIWIPVIQVVYKYIYMNKEVRQ